MHPVRVSLWGRQGDGGSAGGLVKGVRRAAQTKEKKKKKKTKKNRSYKRSKKETDRMSAEEIAPSCHLFPPFLYFDLFFVVFFLTSSYSIKCNRNGKEYRTAARNSMALKFAFRSSAMIRIYKLLWRRLTQSVDGRTRNWRRLRTTCNISIRRGGERRGEDRCSGIGSRVRDAAKEGNDTDLRSVWAARLPARSVSHPKAHTTATLHPPSTVQLSCCELDWTPDFNPDVLALYHQLEIYRLPL